MHQWWRAHLVWPNICCKTIKIKTRRIQRGPHVSWSEYSLRVGIGPQERLDDQRQLRFNDVQVAGHGCNRQDREPVRVCGPSPLHRLFHRPQLSNSQSFGGKQSQLLWKQTENHLFANLSANSFCHQNHKRKKTSHNPFNCAKWLFPAAAGFVKSRNDCRDLIDWAMLGPHIQYSAGWSLCR